MQKQQAALANTMKENYTNTILQQGGGGGTVTVATAQTSEQLVSPRLQPNQLACKENMVGPTHGTSSSSHPMTRSRRHQLQQQQQAVCALQCTEMEVLSDCIVADSLTSSSTTYNGSLGAVSHTDLGGGGVGVVVAPMDCTNTVNSASFSGTGFGGATAVGYGSSLNVSSQVAKPKQQETIGGYDYHQTGAAQSIDNIQPLQSGSLQHIKQQPQVPVLGFGMGMTFTPLPTLQWTQSTDLWRRMRAKDVTRVAPETELRIQHPGILPSMRVILFDWMMEVCEEYKLHRETYYLSVDMYDRFMDTQTGIQKEQLQLIGVTCLFIASKIEEIYPPKVSEFAYVTDGACTISNVLDTELIICKALNWKLNHHVVTVNTWVNTYMQLGSHHLRPSGIKAREFEYPAYSCLEFIRVMQLLDLCMLDIASRQFSSSVLAASAVYLVSERSRAHLEVITGLELSDIHVCVNWMQPCSIVLSHKGPIKQRTFSGVIPQDSHNIQTHEVSISMLDDAVELRRSQESAQSQLSLLQDCSVFMTPPRPERKCLAPINTTC